METLDIELLKVGLLDCNLDLTWNLRSWILFKLEVLGYSNRLKRLLGTDTWESGAGFGLAKLLFLDLKLSSNWHLHYLLYPNFTNY